MPVHIRRVAVPAVVAAVAITVPAVALAAGASPSAKAPASKVASPASKSGAPASKPGAPASKPGAPASKPGAPASKSAAASKLKARASRAGGGRAGLSFTGPAAVAALASRLGVSTDAAKHALLQITALSGRTGLDPADPAFAAIARGLGVTSVQLADALSAVKQSLAGR